MTERKVRFISLLALPLSVACDRDRDDFRDCSNVDTSLATTLPDTLSATPLYSDITADITADIVSDQAIEFEPRFPLWTDGATKRRWLILPDGESIDTSDADNWVFPVGTHTFKEFTRDGVRVETRLNLKTATGWAAAAYHWNADGTDATRVLEAASNVLGTSHDVPAATECAACHGGRGDFTLGFSATQLDVDTRIALYADGLLSDPVEGDLQLDAVEATGLGHLHGNCSHCHNPARDQQPQSTDCYSPGDEADFDLSLPFDLQAASDAPAVRTARRELGNARDSQILGRMSTRVQDDERPSMPPLGTEVVDDEGVAAVRALIEAL